MKESIKRIPIFGYVAKRLYWHLVTKRTGAKRFPGSNTYWEQRYASGGDSGPGSYGKLSEFKAAVLNEFVTKHDVRSVIEFGCGDGNQLALAKYPTYFGLDVSEVAVGRCRKLFAADTSKRFGLMAEYAGEKADLALSLDVIFHLVEDDVFESHMKTLFESANRYVIIYASDCEDTRGLEGFHVRHRKFSVWIQQNLPQWKLIEHIPNKHPYRGDYKQGSFADFFMYTRA